MNRRLIFRLSFQVLSLGLWHTAAGITALAASHTVNFSNNTFSPSALTVNVGDTVTFQNKGGFHTVTGTGGDPFCGNATVTTSCSVTFNTAGTFPYRCVFHSTGGATPAGMTGSITVQGAAAKPNLTPFRINGWSSPVVLSRAPGANISDPDFADDQDVWLDWAIANVSLTTGIPQKFFTEVLIDGVSKASWFHDGLAPDTFNKIEDFNLGKLPLGDHVLRLVTDHTAVVDESDETDNTFETTFRVIPSTAKKYVVLVSDFRFNPPVLTVEKGATVDFQILSGSHTATGTGADPFCGNNAINTVCSTTFNTLGRFPYRCLFHSTAGSSDGMVGEINVVDEIIVESATKVQGPYITAAGARVDYAKKSASFVVPFAPTYWRLNSSSPLRIKSIERASPNLVLTFE